MSAPTEDINRLILSGEVIAEPVSRATPAGISITRFTLEHLSEQLEAGNPRKAKCRIVVTLVGDELNSNLTGLVAGAKIRVEGFICYESSREMETRLVLHAQQLSILKH